MRITVIYDSFFEELSDELMGRIRDAAPGCEVTGADQKTICVDDLIDSDIVFGRIPPHMLKDLKNLKWMHLGSAGANGMTDISLYANDSVILTKSSGTFGIPISEHIVGMMIALSRGFTYYYDKQQSDEWCNTSPDFHDIYGSTVLIIGLGDIGTQVYKHLNGFGCKFIGFRRDISKPHEYIKDIRSISKLHESLPEADYIVICAPGTVETAGMFGRDEFEIMKKRAIIINVGRGMIIDSNALTDALNLKMIAGAGLDVTDPEPLPPGHPLWKARNIIITPHVSAATQLTTERRVSIFIDLLKKYLSGQEMYNIVDFEAGY